MLILALFRILALLYVYCRTFCNWTFIHSKNKLSSLEVDFKRSGQSTYREFCSAAVFKIKFFLKEKFCVQLCHILDVVLLFPKTFLHMFQHYHRPKSGFLFKYMRVFLKYFYLDNILVWDFFAHVTYVIVKWAKVRKKCNSWKAKPLPGLGFF